MTLEQIDPGAELRVRDVSIEGHESYSSWSLKGKLSTKKRPWWAFWRERPELDPFTLENDLQRLERFYQSEGYWHVKVSHDLHVEEPFADVTLRIEEGRRVKTGEVRIDIRDEPTETEPLPETISLEPGEPFTETEYQQSEADLKRFYLERSYSQVDVERSARVDLSRDLADARFLVTLGPPTSFGETRIEGTENVEPQLVEREIEWGEGDSFDLGPIEKTQNQLLDLQLFRSVRIDWEPREDDPSVVDPTVQVEEQPPRLVHVGVGYSTRDEARLRFNWEHFNWLGDGRQLSTGLKLSTITREITAKVAQPHLFTRRARGILEFRSGQDDEDTFTMFATDFLPRFEYRFSEALAGGLGWRGTYANLSDIDEPTAEAIGGVKRDGFVSGPTLALVHDTTDNPLDPRRGHVLSLQALQSDSVWGGSYRYYKSTAEVKQYVEVLDGTILAARLKVGIGDTLGDPEDFPIFDRYYAGGERSVRGYGRRRLGPLSTSDRPLGGLSLIEGSLELRQQMRGPFRSVLFLDFGQVSLDAHDVPADDLEFAAGPGLGIDTPIGPLGLFIGFPFDPPAGDPAWALHFSIGQFF